jgi:putative spermidine/putrescine transport system ATP-binding protein
MVLGHYAEVSVDLQEYGTIRTFQPRDFVKDLHMGQSVKVSFAKALAYPQT